jgi:hypothetical protein
MALKDLPIPSPGNAIEIATGVFVTPETVIKVTRVLEFEGPPWQAWLDGEPFGSPAAPSVADSETVLSYEAGVKSDLFDKRARLGFTNRLKIGNAHRARGIPSETTCGSFCISLRCLEDNAHQFSL